MNENTTTNTKVSITKALKGLKKNKIDRDFYQKNAAATSVVSALILNAVIQSLMQDVTQSDSPTYKFNSSSVYLYCVCVCEGLSLLFGKFLSHVVMTSDTMQIYLLGNVLLLMPNKPKTLGQADWIWTQCFIWMLFCTILGIVLLVVVIGLNGKPTKVSGMLLIPTLIFLFTVGSFIYYRIALFESSDTNDEILNPNN